MINNVDKKCCCAPKKNTVYSSINEAINYGVLIVMFLGGLVLYPLLMPTVLYSVFMALRMTTRRNIEIAGINDDKPCSNCGELKVVKTLVWPPQTLMCTNTVSNSYPFTIARR